MTANINRTNTTKNAVELRSELQANGTRIEYIIIDGNKVGMLGSVSETDRKAALNALNEAYEAANGNIFEMMQKLSTIAMMEEKEIIADEMLEIEGIEVIMSYRQGKAYTTDGEEIANCDDLAGLPVMAIKEVLIARVKAELK